MNPNLILLLGVAVAMGTIAVWRYRNHLPANALGQVTRLPTGNLSPAVKPVLWWTGSFTVTAGGIYLTGSLLGWLLDDLLAISILFGLAVMVVVNTRGPVAGVAWVFMALLAILTAGNLVVENALKKDLQRAHQQQNQKVATTTTPVQQSRPLTPTPDEEPGRQTTITAPPAPDWSQPFYFRNKVTRFDSDGKPVDVQVFSRQGQNVIHEGITLSVGGGRRLSQGLRGGPHQYRFRAVGSEPVTITVKEW